MAELTVGSNFADHRLEAVAGRGGMGVVYRATDLALERTVALKVIAPELTEDHRFARRFVRESKMAAAIRDPHVLPVYRAGEEEGHLFVTMDFVEGRDLRDWIDEEGRLEPALAADVVAQVAQALDAAHAKGLVHRDVKPANVLIEEGSAGPHAYLTDFGLTKPEASAETALTETGMVIGTLDYMAPEQLAGKPVDARSDVYALGCVLFEALTGRVPFPAASAIAKMYAHGNEPAPSPLEVVPDLPPGLAEVTERAMAKDPAERFLSAGDLGRAASAASQGHAAPLTEEAVATGAAAFAETETRRVATAEEPTDRLEPEAPASPPPIPHAHSPAATPAGEPGAKRTRRPLVAAGLALAAVVLAVVIGIAVVGGGDAGDIPTAPDAAEVVGAAGTETSTQAATTAEAAATTETGPTEEDLEQKRDAVAQCLQRQGWDVFGKDSSAEEAGFLVYSKIGEIAADEWDGIPTSPDWFQDVFSFDVYATPEEAQKAANLYYKGEAKKDFFVEGDVAVGWDKVQKDVYTETPRSVLAANVDTAEGCAAEA